MQSDNFIEKVVGMIGREQWNKIINGEDQGWRLCQDLQTKEGSGKLWRNSRMGEAREGGKWAMTPPPQ